MLDPISCQLVSLLSGVDWPLAPPFANCPLRVPLSNSSRVPLPTSGHVVVWFRAKTDKGIVCLADHLHSVTLHQWDIRLIDWILALMSTLIHWEMLTRSAPDLLSESLHSTGAATTIFRSRLSVMGIFYSSMNAIRLRATSWLNPSFQIPSLIMFTNPSAWAG